MKESGLKVAEERERVERETRAPRSSAPTKKLGTTSGDAQKLPSPSPMVLPFPFFSMNNAKHNTAFKAFSTREPAVTSCRGVRLHDDENRLRKWRGKPFKFAEDLGCRWLLVWPSGETVKPRAMISCTRRLFRNSFVPATITVIVLIATVTSTTTPRPLGLIVGTRTCPAFRQEEGPPHS